MSLRLPSKVIAQLLPETRMAFDLNRLLDEAKLCARFARRKRFYLAFSMFSLATMSRRVISN
jgi:hypothetical protein